MFVTLSVIVTDRRLVNLANAESTISVAPGARTALVIEPEYKTDDN